MNEPEPENQSPTDLNHSYDINTEQTPFFPVSEGKLITLYILSLGLYGVYWFYKNWDMQRDKIDKKIYPVWRAIFSIFFTHSLFRRINQQATHLENQHKFNANLLATFFVVAIIVSNVLDPFSANTSLLLNMTNNTVIITSFILFFLSVYPLIKVQATVNRINNDMLGYLNHKFSLWNYVLIIFGSILWLLVVMGVLAELMGLTEFMAM